MSCLLCRYPKELIMLHSCHCIHIATYLCCKQVDLKPNRVTDLIAHLRSVVAATSCTRWTYE